ncbi:MAG: pyridoxamine kinase [Oscillospiraceae bacterium]|nr:pyridoxamine kinase [Oscillospiraceae bacterium]
MSVAAQKRVAAIHDLSGFGRCSLTVIIPTLSAMGTQVCPVPTAILSTHTGGFSGMVFRDLTDYIGLCCNHYKKLEISFDAIYSGFLASTEQIEGCLRFFKEFPSALKIVDPVMGDNGKPYQTYTKELCARMSELTGIADIITPNLTEAAILLGEDFPANGKLNHTTAYNWLERLCERTPTVIITGVCVDDKVCNIGLERFSREIHCVDYQHIPVHYPGTGDIFASVLTGAILNGHDLRTAISRATRFARKSVELTYKTGGESRNGVMFEKLLSELM